MDTLPRVPDVNGGGVETGGVLDEKLFSDLYTRTSWVDAAIALDQIEKVSPEKKTQDTITQIWEWDGIPWECPPVAVHGITQLESYTVYF